MKCLVFPQILVVCLIVSLVAVVDVASVLLCTSVFGVNTWD